MILANDMNQKCLNEGFKTIKITVYEHKTTRISYYIA